MGKYIKIINDKYTVFEDGNVYSNITDRFLNGANVKGYKVVCLSKKTFLVHRLVWEAFNGPIPDGYEIDHINGIKDDNRLENLRCVTHLENMRNPVTRPKHLEAMRKLWLNDTNRKKVAESAKKQKQNPENIKRWRELLNRPEVIKRRLEAVKKRVIQIDVHSGETIKVWDSATAASKALGISNACISICCNGKTKTAGHFKWRFE